MRTRAATAALTAAAAAVTAVSLLSPLAEAATVDAEKLTTVAVNAPLYDTNNCDPTGCVGDLTRVSLKHEGHFERRGQKLLAKARYPLSCCLFLLLFI